MSVWAQVAGSCRGAAVVLAVAALTATSQAEVAAGPATTAGQDRGQAVAGPAEARTGDPVPHLAATSGDTPGSGATIDSGAAPAAADTAPVAASPWAAGGIPSVAREAYDAAAAAAPADCGIPWSLVAAIGRVESDHGRFAGAVLLTDGRSAPPILGIPLDGTRSALIRDTDGGRLDGDTVYDRAVGPMQFIPSTWALYESDGDGDGDADPFDVQDAALATARYLCAAGGDLTTVAGQRRAVFAYNHSDEYVTSVLTLAADYAGTAVPIVPTEAVPPPSVPPANPAPPPALPAAVPPVPPGASPPPAPAPTSVPPAAPAPVPAPSTGTPPPTSPASPTPPPPSAPPTVSSPPPTPSTTPPAPTTATPTSPPPASPPPSSPAPSSPAPSNAPATPAEASAQPLPS